MVKSSLSDPALSTVNPTEPKAPLEKNVLKSKTFKDGGIYLFIRRDYIKPTWFCRIKAPGMSGYLSRSTRTTDEHAAYKFADNLYNQQLVKALGGQSGQGTKITAGIDAYIDRFESEYGKLSVSYRVGLLKRVRPLIGKLTFEGLTTASITKLTDDLRKGTTTGSMSLNTVKRHHSDLRHFFRWCVEEGYLNEIPKFPRVSSEKSRRPHFNDAEWKKVTRHLQEFVKIKNRKTRRDRMMLRDYVLILANTGIRVGEARALKWRDVRAIIGVDGKPNNIVLTVNGKTGIREVVSRTPVIKTYFRRIYDLRTTEMEGQSPSTDSLVFCHKDGTEIGSFKKSFRTLVKDCGVEADSSGRCRSVYSLRHTYATFRLHGGVNHFALAKNMGTSVQMLEQYYGHTTNLTMSDELTKNSPRKIGQANAKLRSKPQDGGFGWLNDDDGKLSSAKDTDDSEGPSVGLSYVDLVTE